VDDIGLLIDHYEKGCMTGNPAHTNALVGPDAMQLKEGVGVYRKVREMQSSTTQENGTENTPCEIEMEQFLNELREGAFRLDRLMKVEITKGISGLLNFLQRAGVDINQLAQVSRNGVDLNCYFWSEGTKDRVYKITTLIYLLKIDLQHYMELHKKFSASGIMMMILRLLFNYVSIDVSALYAALNKVAIPARCWAEELKNCISDVLSAGEFAEIFGADPIDTGIEPQEITDAMNRFTFRVSRAISRLSNKSGSLFDELTAISKRLGKKRDKMIETIQHIEEIMLFLSFLQTLIGIAIDNPSSGYGSFELPEDLKDRFEMVSGGVV
jgi:hypothetical protein